MKTTSKTTTERITNLIQHKAILKEICRDLENEFKRSREVYHNFYIFSDDIKSIIHIKNSFLFFGFNALDIIILFL